MGLRRATTNLGSHRLKPVPQGRKYCRAQATGEDHRLKPVPQVRIESSVGVFFGICVPQAHRDRLGLSERHDLTCGTGFSLWLLPSRSAISSTSATRTTPAIPATAIASGSAISASTAVTIARTFG